MLGAFLVPVSVGSRVLGFDAWQFYTEHVLYLYGELLLVGLLVCEYLVIARPPRINGGCRTDVWIARVRAASP